MYRILFFISFLFLSITVGTQAAENVPLRLPLQPVCVDSVSIEDFFWYGQLQEVKKNFPNLKPSTLKPQKGDTKKWQKLNVQWEKGIKLLGPTATAAGGTSPDEVKAADETARLSARLNFATAQGKYANMFEFIECNSLCGRQQSDNAEERETAAKSLMNIQGQIYATSGEHLFLNHLIRNNAHIVTPDLDVQAVLVVSRPWYNQMILWLKFARQGQRMVLHIAVPEAYQLDSLDNYSTHTRRKPLTIDVGKNHEKPRIENGYYVFDRRWTDDDYVAINFPTPIIHIHPDNDTTQIALQRGPVVYATLNLPQGMYLKAGDAVHSEFDKDRHTNVLSAPYYDAQGRKAGMYLAEPFLFNRRNPQARLFVPALP